MNKILIIGGGVAGLQAGIFTAKAGYETLVFDTEESLIKNTSNIQNLITHDSISGHEVLKKGREKLEQFDGEFIEEEVEKIERKDKGFRVVTKENEFEAEYVIIGSAGNLEFLENLEQIDFEEGVEGPYMMERHVTTDESNKAAEGIFVAGLANSWEYQTATAIGDGAKAAVNVLSEIEGEPFTDHDT